METWTPNKQAVAERTLQGSQALEAEPLYQQEAAVDGGCAIEKQCGATRSACPATKDDFIEYAALFRSNSLSPEVPPDVTMGGRKPQVDLRTLDGREPS